MREIWRNWGANAPPGAFKFFWERGGPTPGLEGEYLEEIERPRSCDFMLERISRAHPDRKITIIIQPEE